MQVRLAAIDRTIPTLTKRLLDSRNAAGHWEGHLSSSALATATATIALLLADREKREKEVVGLFPEHSAIGKRLPTPSILAQRGLAWLTANQNPDGGWGDTVRSISNVSTTVLCWSALSMGRSSHHPITSSARLAIERAERWLEADVVRRPSCVVRKGSGFPFSEKNPDDGLRITDDEITERIQQAVLNRYGKDRTFSVPILTVLALAGKLGSGAEAWRRVPQLPFELAACPHQWFQWLRLPVVSYALPALVAMGQARHRQAPTRNPVLRSIRSTLRPRTLEKLRSMQPTSGGFLEATPLTAFVTMSLIAAGEAEHPVVHDGLRFLIGSARADGSWPIDTNLATWVTTWSIKTLVRQDAFTEGDRIRVIEWLLGQQHREAHPYTHAAPGAWAWTDLPGGVPDADDTAGALLALGKLAPNDPRSRAAAEAGVEWLLDVQNRDGGIPTFCRGWGALPFDRSAPDLTAHALEAWSVWYPLVVPTLQDRITHAARRAVQRLASSQQADGSWSPLWFGNQHVAGELNLTYGTSQVLTALASDLARESDAALGSRARAVRWLLNAQNQDGGWGGSRSAPSSIEETGVALQALAVSWSRQSLDSGGPPVNDALQRGAQWIVTTTHEGQHTPASPIGLYFARLWYFEDLYPVIFALRGLLEARAMLCDRSNQPRAQPLISR